MMVFSRLKTVVEIAVFLLIATFLHYSLPSRDVVRIVGTDVVRTDVQRQDAQGNPITASRDVRFINTKFPNGDDRIFRNEDTGWGWPPYFKFDTADLAGDAADLKSSEQAPKWVVVRHYGWRIPILSMFPNALSIRNASGPDEKLFPWFNVVFISLLVLVVLIVRRALIILFQHHIDPVIDDIDREIDERVGAVTRNYRRARRWFRYRFGL